MRLSRIKRRWEDLPLAHWEQRGDIFSRVRAGWTAEDYQTRRESIFFDLAINPTDRDVLDLGCGLGYLAQHIAPTARSYIGVDWSPHMLRWARYLNSSHPTANFIQNDGSTIPLADSSIDIVISELFFQHIPPAVTDTYIHELKRVLRPSARAYLQFPRPEQYPLSGRTKSAIASLLPGCTFAPGSEPDFYHYVVYEHPA